MKRNIYFIVTLLFLISSILIAGCAQPGSTPSPAPGPSPEKPIELKFSYWPPPVDPWVKQGILTWGPELEEKTNGKVKVVYYGGRSLGAPQDHLQLIMDGTADIGWMNSAMTPGVFPLTDIRNLPFLYPNSNVAAAVFWRQQEFLNDLEYEDKVKPLWTFPTGMMQIASNKPIHSLEDFKGMKFPAVEPITQKTIEAFGATPVAMMEGDIFTGLERGMIDARWQEYLGLLVWKTMEVTKYRTDNLRIFTHQNLIAMNLEKWNSLPIDIQKAIDEVSGFEKSAKVGQIWTDLDSQATQKVLEFDKKVGNPEPYTLPDDERARWVEACKQPVETFWLQEMESKGLGKPAKELLENTKKWIEEYSK
jgi:TRAP-type C4-dicarboxylate transport system substrate-binding protein